MHLSYGVCRLRARVQLKTLSSLLNRSPNQPKAKNFTHLKDWAFSFTKYSDSGDGYTRHRATGYDPAHSFCPFGVCFALVCQWLVLGDAKHKDSLRSKANTWSSCKKQFSLRLPFSLFYCDYCRLQVFSPLVTLFVVLLRGFQFTAVVLYFGQVQRHSTWWVHQGLELGLES